MFVPFAETLAYMEAGANNDSPESIKLTSDITVCGTYVASLTRKQQSQFWNALGSYPALTKLKLQFFHGFDSTSIPLEASALVSVLKKKQRSMEEEWQQKSQSDICNDGNKRSKSSSHRRRHKGIEEIIFGSDQLTGNLQALSAVLQSHTSLRMVQTWDLEDGDIDPATCTCEVCTKDQMLLLLVNVRQLKQLVLGNFQATRERMNIIAQALSQEDNRIKALRIRGFYPGPLLHGRKRPGQKLDSETCSFLASMLEKNESLERLVLNHFDIVSPAISQSSRTDDDIALSLVEQAVANTGLVTIMKALEKNKTLKSFQLLFGNYKMKPTDADALINLLMKHNHVLQTFSVSATGGLSRTDKKTQRELAQAHIIDFYMAMNRDGLRNKFFGDTEKSNLIAFFEVLAASQSRYKDDRRVPAKKERKELTGSEIKDRNRYQITCLFHLLRENGHIFCSYLS